MVTPAMLNESTHAEDPARQLLEQMGWTYVPREALAAERSGEREVLLKAAAEGRPVASQRVADRGSGGAGHLRAGARQRGRHRPQPETPRVLDLRAALDRQHHSTGRTPATSASSTSTTPTADSTSSSSPPSSGCGAATRRAKTRTTSG